MREEYSIRKSIISLHPFLIGFGMILCSLFFHEWQIRNWLIKNGTAMIYLTGVVLCLKGVIIRK